ncbi:MAG: glycosyltransferase family protein [Ruminococcus flavefaciens]|nr:glycosyltransferase family protein [Ruminococcus flavefaciens]
MKYIVMVQARCSSHRLPSKVLKDLYGKTVLERVIERIQLSKLIDEVMVVTSLNKEDIQIVELMSKKGIRVFAGSLDDVLDRYYQAAKILRPEYVIRITADCPLIDYKVIDGAIQSLQPDTEYLGMISETFPDGEDVEIVRFDALRKSWEEAKLSSEREHVTMYIKNHKEDFRIIDYVCKEGNLNQQRWTLDEPEDYEFVKNVYGHFLSAGYEKFDMLDILEYLKENPQVQKINQGFIRNEGLLISQKNDKLLEQSDLF